MHLFLLILGWGFITWLKQALILQLSCLCLQSSWNYGPAPCPYSFLLNKFEVYFQVPSHQGFYLKCLSVHSLYKTVGSVKGFSLGLPCAMTVFITPLAVIQVQTQLLNGELKVYLGDGVF